MAVVLYIYEQRKTGSVSKEPFLANAPSSEGGERFGWIPRYPVAELSDIHSRVTHGELNYGFEFRTGDDVRKIISFYEERLRAGGFTVLSKDKGGVEIDLHGESPDRKRIIDITAEQSTDKSGSGTGVTVAALQK